MGIRIENRALIALAFPAEPNRGNRSPMHKIPAGTNGPDGIIPGVLELASLDAVSLERLKYHYDRRPFDGKVANKAETDDSGNPRYLEIGLLKIIVTGGKTVADDAPSAAPSAPAANASSSVEPPRRATPKAAKPKPAAAPAPVKRTAKKSRVA